MRSPLEARIAALRGRVRRLLALHGLAWVVGAFLLATILAGLLDWVVPGHLAREVRLALLIGTIALAGWLAIRYVAVPLVVRFRDLDIALKIERRWPGLNDRLTSTVQFLQIGRSGDRDDILGSQALREATIRQTLQEVEQIDFRQAIDPRPARRASLSAASAMLLGFALVALAPASSRIALARFFRPFGPDQWPKLTRLAVVRAAPKVARGEEFRLEVAVLDGYRVPSSAKATYRYDDGQVETEALRSDDRGHFHGRRETVARSFRVSVAAGDDATAPRPVEVVPPPSLADVTIRLIPPAYTALPTQVLAPGRTEFQAVRGTKVEVEGRANKPIAAAMLRRGDGARTLAIKPDGGRIATGFALEESGPFWFELTDTEGFRSQPAETTRFEARATPDEEPRVVIDEPTNDRDVTPNAVVPVAIAADDDYGLGMVRLLYKVSPSGSEPNPETVVPLWSIPPGSAPVKHRDAPHTWDLASLNLQPGAVITFHADARDLDAINPQGPKLGKSRELRLRIVSPEQINRQMEDRRREIRDAIQRLLDMQKQAQTPVEEARRALAKLDRLDKPARDDLANAGVIQRQVGDRVTDKADGLDHQIRRYLDDLRDLKLESPDTQKQMEQMRDAVGRIRDDHLGPAEQGLSRANKALDDASDDQAQEQGQKGDAEKSEPKGEKSSPAAKSEAGKKSGAKPSGDAGKGESSKADSSRDGEQADAKPQAGREQADAKDARTALDDSAKHQKEIADELARMLDSLKEFDTYRGIVQDAKKLLKEHEEVMKQANEAASQPDLAGKTPDELTQKQKVDLSNVANRQGEVAKSLQQLENKMDELSGRLDEQDPLGASSLRDAAQQSRQKGTSAKAGESADRLEKNQMGEAQAGQKQVQNDLKKLIDSLANRRENELSRLVKELKDVEKDLKNLRDRQAKNKADTQKAGQKPGEKERKEQLQKLAKEQEEIQKELKKRLQKLRKLRADAAAGAGEKASGKMAQAQKDQEDDDAEDAGKKQEEALKGLEEAQEETKQARQEAEEQLAMEQLSKMADNLKALGEQQDKVLSETADYQEKQAGDKRLTRAQQAGVRGLARAQDSIKDETNSLIERLTEAPVFSLTLKRAAESMDVASGRLRQLQTDDDTQIAQRTASRRFKQLLDALKPDPAEGGQQGGGGQGGQGGGGGGGGDGITKAAQIKMLKMLQQELNDRTEEIDTLRARLKEKGGLSPQQEQELTRLENDQRGIADLARDLTRPKHDDGEED